MSNPNPSQHPNQQNPATTGAQYKNALEVLTQGNVPDGEHAAYLSNFINSRPDLLQQFGAYAQQNRR